MPPARPDILAAAQHGAALQQVPFRDRRACSGCRAIKSRCMAQEGSSACVRCVRLQLTCNYLEHHRGIAQEDSSEAGGLTSRKRKSRSRDSKTLANELHSSQRSRSLSDPSEHAHGGVDSTSAIATERKESAPVDRAEATLIKRRGQPFSIQSMLAVDADTAGNANLTLLSSTTFASMQDDGEGDSSVKVVGSAEKGGGAGKGSGTTDTSDGRRTAKNSTASNIVAASTDPREYTPIIANIAAAGVLHADDVRELIHFFFAKLNPIIALLDPLLYTEEALLTSRRNRMLLATVCTVSAKFCMPHAYMRCLDFLEAPLAKIASQDVAPQLDYVLSLSILAMWKHPQDGSSWRKLRLAITMALELGLHRTFDDVVRASSSTSSQHVKKRAPSRMLVQRQRTYLQLACFEDGYQDQRRIPMAIDKASLPEPWHWIEWLGDQVQDIDVRLAASRENALVKQDLLSKLKRIDVAGGPRKAVALRRVQWIEMAIAAERANTRVWKQPEAYGLGKGRQHAGRPCLIFHTTNTMFNYHRALYAVYCSAPLTGLDADRKQSVFLECCRLSVELFELMAGPYGQQDYFRFVHDIVILNLAVAAVWISDNWHAMPKHLAVMAGMAVATAANVTASCMDRQAEQASYLARFLAFCARRIALLQEKQQQEDLERQHQQERQLTMIDHGAHAPPPAAPFHTSAAEMSFTLADFTPAGPLTIPTVHAYTGGGDVGGSSANLNVAGNASSNAPAGSAAAAAAAAAALTAFSVSPESLNLADWTSGASVGDAGDPSLQYLQDLLSLPCVQLDDRDGHNILSFFQDDRGGSGGAAATATR